MIDFVKIKGYSTDSGDTLSLRHKAGTTYYVDRKFDDEKSAEYEKATRIITFKVKKAQCRFYEKLDKESGEYVTDYNMYGSLQRFTIGKSYTDFYYADVQRDIIKMCEECRFDIYKPHRIMEIEIGVNLTVSCDPDDFLTMFKLFWGAGFHEMRVLSGEKRPHGIERVLSDMYKIKIYNKTVYAKRVEKLSPSKNKLRVEVQFMTRAIDEYELPDTVQKLCDRELFQKYVDKFCEIVKNIQMADWLYDVSDLKGRDLRSYMFMHGDIHLYSEYLKRIEGDRKAIESEKNRCKKINTLLKGRKTLKEEFINQFDDKVRKLMRPK